MCWLVIVKRGLYLSLLLWIGLLWSYHWSTFIFLHVITRCLVGAIIWRKRCSRWSWVTIWTLVTIAIIALVTVASSSFLLLLVVMVVVAVLLLHSVAVVAGVVVGVVGCCCFWILMVLLIPGKVARAALILDPLILWWPEERKKIQENAWIFRKYQNDLLTWISYYLHT